VELSVVWEPDHQLPRDDMSLIHSHALLKSSISCLVKSPFSRPSA